MFVVFCIEQNYSTESVTLSSVDTSFVLAGHAALQGVSKEENQGADLVRDSTNQDLGLKIIVAPLALLSSRNSKSRKQWNLQRM